MRQTSGGIRGPLTGRRARLIFLFVLFLVVVALAWHLVGMAEHSMAMLGGACLAVLAMGLLIVSSPAARPCGPTPAIARTSRTPRPLPPRFGRHPPDEGVVLLM
jgi:hypothetical protein